MHSVESLRQIRALEYMFGSGNEGYSPGRYNRSPPRETSDLRLSPREPGGEVTAVLEFDLRTREITVRPADSMD